MSTAIVCLGNELVGDDGIGIRVGRVLSRLPLPAGVCVMIRANAGLELIEWMHEHERVVIVDAMTGPGEPGACVWVDCEGPQPSESCPCAHTLAIADIARLAAALAPERACARLAILGVRGAVLDTFGVGLSGPVQAALPDAVDRLLQAVGASEALRARGRRESERECAAVRGVGQVLREALGGDEVRGN